MNEPYEPSEPLVCRSDLSADIEFAVDGDGDSFNDVREFAVNGNGDYETMLAAIKATNQVWLGNLFDQKVVLAYLLKHETDELLASVIAAVKGSGYVITRTRLRKLCSCDYWFAKSQDGWLDFSQFEAERLKFLA